MADSTYDGLHTLRAAQSLVETGTIDLFTCDSAGNPLYRPQIDDADEPAAYAVSLHHERPGVQSLIDPLSVQLHNPPANVQFKNKTLISFEWSFRWENVKYSWHRDRESISTRNSGYTCKMSRKPDPDVSVASYRQSKKGPLLQFLDYNIDRFLLEDRKGLEIVVLSTLYSIVLCDRLDEGANASVGMPLHTSTITSGSKHCPSNCDTRSPSPMPDVDRRQSLEGEQMPENEILITQQLSESAYVEHCLSLLQDINLIFLTLMAANAETVTRAIRIASEVKRRRQKTNDEDLLQFLDFPGRTRRCSDGSTSAVPPTEIKIFLSRIPLEEFMPDAPLKSGAPPIPARVAQPRFPARPPLPAKEQLAGSQNANTGRQRFWKRRPSDTMG